MAESVNSGADARYKIGDVCRMADVQPYVLRYWESEFPVLAADRSQAGPRTYSARELKLIEQIKRLLYDEGYTIAGAKKRLESESGRKAERADTEADTNPVVAPIPAEPAKKTEKAAAPSKAEKVEKAEKAEKSEKSPRETRPKAPALANASKFELPAPDLTQPVAARAAAAGEARRARAVEELRDVLALLSRPLP